MTKTEELSFEVEGLPPAKGEALSMLGAGHSHRERVLRLLETPQSAAASRGFRTFGSEVRIGLEVVLRTPTANAPGDATNYLGGIADVLQGRRANADVAHLGPAANFLAYADDRQIRDVRYSEERADRIGYKVRVWRLGGTA